MSRIIILAALAMAVGCTGSGRYSSRDASRYPPERESYAAIRENPAHSAEQRPLSTFSIDVDTASYSNIRRFLNDGRLPPKDAVRIEEMINYFTYRYPKSDGRSPLSAAAEVADSPWKRGDKIVLIGVRARGVDEEKRHPRNLVFLIDVSGSMSSADKLPLVKDSLRLLAEDLDEEDSVAIVVYAGAAGMVLEPTRGDRRRTILNALDRLQAGGSTNGGEGIRLAYRTAEENFIRDGVNRVILCTDGDFNVGATDHKDLVRLIEEKRKSGVFLSCFGYGTGNLKDDLMEQLADRGNGNYAYIDSIDEARRVFVEKLSATLIPVANDVKIQVEFNPETVASYRLIGYENRLMRDRDFKDDRKDAGDIGAGHTVTALYEVVPVRGSRVNADRGGIPLKYRHRRAGDEEKDDEEEAETDASGEICTVKIRYKPVRNPGETRDVASRQLTFPIRDEGQSFDGASSNLRFACAVAAFGMLLRDSDHPGSATYGDVADWAGDALDGDRKGERREFLDLVKKARRLSGGD